MMFNDEELRKAVQELRDSRLEDIAKLGDEPIEFSTAFSESIDRMIRQRKRKDTVFRTIRRSAAAILALLICSGVWLAVDVDARAAFFTWTREVYEESFVYRFFSEETPDMLPDYEITALPEGYILIDSKSGDTSVVKIYGCADSFIGLMYCYASNGYTDIFSETGEKYSDTKVQVQEMAADFYTANTKDEPNELVWIDEKANILFELSACLDQSAMIKMAESISVNKP